MFRRVVLNEILIYTFILYKRISWNSKTIKITYNKTWILQIKMILFIKNINLNENSFIGKSGLVEYDFNKQFELTIALKYQIYIRRDSLNSNLVFL